MAQTIRFPENLKIEATAYAEALGISLNALCAVALRDYLDGRVKAAERASRVLQRAYAQSLGSAAAKATTTRSRRPAQSLNSPCACGSGLKYKRCCGATLV